ncbi:hypothetical protein A2U01_0003064 [Trifolium medium]|uniref:Uncharacterized protein n=1 Tax=Trifolium medium TaxID=97028 RepID=A0A392M5B0_9FABA|nr:hypothetical protein [Trifolium medium]
MKHVGMASTSIDDIMNELSKLPEPNEIRTKRSVSRRFGKLKEKVEKERSLKKIEELEKELAGLKASRQEANRKLGVIENRNMEATNMVELNKEVAFEINQVDEDINNFVKESLTALDKRLTHVTQRYFKEEVLSMESSSNHP